MPLISGRAVGTMGGSKRGPVGEFELGIHRRAQPVDGREPRRLGRGNVDRARLEAHVVDSDEPLVEGDDDMLGERVTGDREVEVGREPTSLAESELPDRGPTFEHDVIGTAREQALADHPFE